MPRKKKPVPETPLINDEDILVDGKFFQGNQNLLSRNAKIAWTPEMLEENKVCRRNIIHFAERHFYIITENGKEKIKLRNFQKEMLRSFKRDKRHVILSSRQSGKCLKDNTLCRIRNKQTGLIEEITILELLDRAKNSAESKTT